MPERTSKSSQQLPPRLAKRVAATQAVLLDFDGTIADTIELITHSFRYTIQRVLRRELPDDELIANVGMPLPEQMRIFSPEKEQELVEVYREHNHAHHDDMIEEFPGAKEALERLRAAGLKLAIVTSKSRALAQRGLELLGMADLFDAGVFVDDTELHKPDAEPVLEALRQLGVDPVAAVFIGDSPHDITAGRAAGVVTIAALWGPFPRERVLAAGPDIVLESLDEFVELMTTGRA